MSLNLLKHKRIIVSIFFVFILFCSNKGYDNRLIQYLKEERRLRQHITQTRELEDSITSLQRRYHIDKERELARLRKQPKLWLKLLEELKHDR